MKAEPEQPVRNPQAKAAPDKARAEAADAAGWIAPSLVGVLVAVLGLGGLLMLTNLKQPAAEQVVLAEVVEDAPPAINLPEELETRMRQERTPRE